MTDKRVDIEDDLMRCRETREGLLSINPEDDMELSAKDLLKWLILKEEIENLKQQQRWTSDSIVSLERTYEDYRNLGTSLTKEYVVKARKTANKDLRNMNRELLELWAQKRAIEKKVRTE